MAKIGRPQKTTQSLPENWKEMMYDWASQGMSDVEIRANFCLLGGTFSECTWLAMQKREEEFLNTVKKAHILCQAWWERKARENLYHGKEMVFETGAWNANMKNRFGWRDINHNVNLNGDSDNKAFCREFFGLKK